MTLAKRTTGRLFAIMAGVMLVFVGALVNVNDVSATKYESSQAISGANDCGNGKLPMNILCQNLASQIDGDGNAINIIAVQPASDDGLELLP